MHNYICILKLILDGASNHLALSNNNIPFQISKVFDETTIKCIRQFGETKIKI
jgi:hypothetical protein